VGVLSLLICEVRRNAAKSIPCDRCLLVHMTDLSSPTLRSRAVRYVPAAIASRLYRVRDWLRFRSSRPGLITIAGTQVRVHRAEQFRNRLRSEELPVFLRALENVDIVVDLGANVGVFTILAAARGIPVLSIEPNPQNCQHLLTAIAELNDADRARITILPVAASGTTEPIWLYGGGQSSSIHGNWLGRDDKYRQLAPCVTMPQLMSLTPPGSRALIKMDVEGAESTLLESISDWADGSTRKLPIVMFEHGRPDAPPVQEVGRSSVFAALDLAGFVTSALKEDVELVDAVAGEATLREWSPATGSEINFIALPPDIADLQVRVAEGGHVGISGIRRMGR
jgi:FkbM family methyltransferase